MKNIKLFLISLFTLSALSLTFSSCSKNDDDDNIPSTPITVSQVVGSWMCTASEDTYDGHTESNLLVGVTVTLNADGTFSSTGYTIGRGTWTLRGNEVTARSNMGTFVLNASLSGNTMKWVGTASNGVKFRYTFRKLF